jgi:hypothetical protein
MMTDRDDEQGDDGLQRRRVRSEGDSPAIVIEDDDAAARFEQLGLEVPALAILPRNFASATEPGQFVFEATTSTIRTLGRRVGLTLAVPGPTAYRGIHEKDHDVVAPVVQFAHAFLIEGGAVLVVEFLKELSRHVASRWGQKAARERHAVFEIVVTRGKRARRVTYNGPLEGLPSIVDVASRAFDEEEVHDR